MIFRCSTGPNGPKNENLCSDVKLLIVSKEEREYLVNITGVTDLEIAETLIKKIPGLENINPLYAQDRKKNKMLWDSKK